MTDRRTFLKRAGALAAWAAVRPAEAVGASPPGAMRPVGDARFVRRASLALCGRLPAWRDVAAYVASRDPDKKARLVDRLVASPDHVDFRTLHLADELRVKSEFPINLWPNAVYAYHAFLREHVAADGSGAALIRTLLSARGSNFRVPAVNFLRASAVRTPEGLSETVSGTFLDARTPAYERYFRGVTYTPTHEWKEECVGFPAAGATPAALAEILVTDPRFPRTAVRRAHFRLFGAYPSESETARYARLYVRNGHRLGPVYREMALSDAFASAAYVPRRLEAEVLDDALCDLTGAKRAFRSMAPEPFTFLPGERKTVCLEDGSITNAFLLLFGRPARDTGDLSERDDSLTAKHRLYLMNAAQVYRRLKRIKGSAQDIFRRFLSRDMTPAEAKLFNRLKLAPADVAWCVVNGEEFLMRS